MKKLMKTGPCTTELIDVDMPVIEKPTQMIVKLKYCGVCMSEHYDWSADIEPRSFGHEPIGVVTEIGSGVTKVKVGDRVSGLFDGSCEYSCANEDDVVIIPDNVTDEEAVIEPLACLISAVSKIRLPLHGNKVAVVGCGYMGCGAISLLAMRGVDVVAVDINKISLQNALKYGAKEIYTPDELPAGYRTCDGDPAKTGFELVMEWGETNESLDLAINMTRQCGQLAIGAYHTGGKRLVDVQQLNVKAIDCLSTHPREWELQQNSCRAAMKLLSETSWVYKNVPTKVYPITQFDKAQGELPEKFGKWLKALVDWTKTEGEPYIIG